jgi:hypothetical protein
LKLWLLDADVIIDLLSCGLFDTLVTRHEVYTASTVIDEVKSYKKEGRKEKINFRQQYIQTGRLYELTASVEDVNDVLSSMTSLWKQTLHAGELESLALLKRNEELIICSCDAATIRALPFLDASERGISVEKLIATCGLKKVHLKARHKEKYFQNNLAIGKQRWIQSFGR